MDLSDCSRIWLLTGCASGCIGSSVFVASLACGASRSANSRSRPTPGEDARLPRDENHNERNRELLRHRSDGEFLGNAEDRTGFNRHFATRQQAIREITEYIEVFYNRQRIQKKLDYLSPVAFERRFYEQRMAA